MNYYNHLTNEFHVQFTRSPLNVTFQYDFALSPTKGVVRFSHFANVNYNNLPEVTALFTREAQRKGVNDLIGVYSPTDYRYWFTTNADYYCFQEIERNSTLSGQLYEEFYDIEENYYRREQYQDYFNVGYVSNLDEQYLDAYNPLGEQFGYYTYSVSETEYAYFDVTNIQNMKTYKTDLYNFYEYSLSMDYSTTNYAQNGDKIYDFYIKTGSYSSTLVDNAFQNGYNTGLGAGFTQGYQAGYDEGVADANATTAQSATAFNYIGQAFGAVNSVLSLEILPHVTLGLCFSIPLVFVLIMTLFKLVKK